MNYFKYGCIVFLLIIACACLDAGSKSSRHDRSITIPGSVFETREAEEFNDEGIAQSKKGKFETGKQLFLKALKIEPNNPTVLANLGLNRYMVYDYKNAIDHYQKSYEMSDSTYHIAAVNMGLTYYYDKQFEKGIEITTYVIDNAEDEFILTTARVHRGLNYFGKQECNNLNMDIQFIFGNYYDLEGIQYHIDDLSSKLKECDRNKEA